jgi:3-oxoacid CoA-transferase subunit A/glutaconate CoA-transferase subunit A
MDILQEGQGQLVGWHDPDENRQWVLENKSRELRDKQMTAAEAVARFVPDGAFLCFDRLNTRPRAASATCG